MALLETLIKTKTPAPPKLIVYGQPGVGKTSLAAQADAVLLDCENGASAVPDLMRTPYLKTWLEMRQWLSELAAVNEPPPVVAVDTIDWMVQRIAEYVTIDLDPKANGNVCNTLGSSHGGYYKAREIVANIVYRDLLPLLNALANRGATILLLAHACNTEMTTPEGFDIKLAAPDLPQWIAPPFIEWADCVLYAQKIGDRRILTTAGTNIILAKNRYSLPPELSLSWADLTQAIANGAAITTTNVTKEN